MLRVEYCDLTESDSNSTQFYLLNEQERIVLVACVGSDPVVLHIA